MDQAAWRTKEENVKKELLVERGEGKDTHVTITQINYKQKREVGK